MDKRGFESHFKKVLTPDGSFKLEERKKYKNAQLATSMCLKMSPVGFFKPYFCQYCNNYHIGKK